MRGFNRFTFALTAGLLVAIACRTSMPTMPGVRVDTVESALVFGGGPGSGPADSTHTKLILVTFKKVCDVDPLVPLVFGACNNAGTSCGTKDDYNLGTNNTGNFGKGDEPNAHCDSSLCMGNPVHCGDWTDSRCGS